MALNKRKQTRLIIIGAAGLILAAAAGLSLYALNDQIVFFKTPTDIAEEGLKPGQRVRIGGLVKEGTWVREGTSHDFVVTDLDHDVPVHYVGVLPDLFREGQGVVLDGSLDTKGDFEADTVLAKHDEKYVPKEVEAALKDKGLWQESGKTLVDEPAKGGAGS